MNSLVSLLSIQTMSLFPTSYQSHTYSMYFPVRNTDLHQYRRNLFATERYGTPGYRSPNHFSRGIPGRKRCGS